MEPHIVELMSLVDSLVRAGNPPDTAGFTKISHAIAKVFTVDPDEVAILSLDRKNKNLKFVIPEKLAAVGSIPLSSTSALAARTARERRPELSNSFSSSRHASVFEGVPLGRKHGDMIQKLMSAPVLDGSSVVGVVQISRKGQSPTDAGQDFTQKDLRTLTSLSPALDRFLKLCREA